MNTYLVLQPGYNRTTHRELLSQCSVMHSFCRCSLKLCYTSLLLCYVTYACLIFCSLVHLNNMEDGGIKLFSWFTPFPEHRLNAGNDVIKKNLKSELGYWGLHPENTIFFIFIFFFNAIILWEIWNLAKYLPFGANGNQVFASHSLKKACSDLKLPEQKRHFFFFFTN